MSSGEGDRVLVLLWGLLGSDGTDILLSSARYLYFCNDNTSFSQNQMLSEYTDLLTTAVLES
jgi:hypothetical protein